MMPATQFRINQGNGEIGFDHVNNVSSILRVNDIKANLSALQRVKAATIAAKPTP